MKIFKNRIPQREVFMKKTTKSEFSVFLQGLTEEEQAEQLKISILSSFSFIFFTSIYDIYMILKNL